MAGGAQKYRHLSRDSAARQALLRGLVTSLVQHEHIMTTKAKAKEAARMAEKLITLAKNDTPTTRRLAQGMLYEPHTHLPKLFGELKTRFADREGGYTRVVKTEPRNRLDQAETAILEYVDGPKDTRFMMTAKTIARDRLLGRPTSLLTTMNTKKVTQFRGEKPLEDMVRKFMKLSTNDPDRSANAGMPSTEERYPNKNTRGFEARLANFDIPADKPDESTTLPPKRYARPLETEGSKFEAEAEQAAAAEAAKTSDLGSQIVPKKAKQEGKKAQ